MNISHDIVPTPWQAYELLTQLKNGEPLKSDEVDRLVNFFSDTPWRPATTAMEWVARACDLDSTHIEYYTLHVIDGVAFATDGKRSHHTSALYLADGIYDVNQMRRGIIQNTLDFTIPKLALTEMVQTTQEHLRRLLAKDCTPCIEVPFEIAVRESHFMDALNGSAGVPVYFNDQYMTGNSTYGGWILNKYRI